MVWDLQCVDSYLADDDDNKKKIEKSNRHQKICFKIVSNA